jgi:DNA-binding NtrC family response regulator
MGKQVDSIPPETMAAFQWYSWPGNIRELQNLVERAVILSRNGVLPNPLHKNQTELMIPTLHHTRTFHTSKTLDDSDRALFSWLERLSVTQEAAGSSLADGWKLASCSRQQDLANAACHESLDVTLAYLKARMPNPKKRRSSADA